MTDDPIDFQEYEYLKGKTVQEAMQSIGHEHLAPAKIDSVEVPLIQPLDSSVSFWQLLTAAGQLFIRNYITVYFSKGATMTNNFKTSVMGAVVAIGGVIAYVFHWTIDASTLELIAGLIVGLILHFWNPDATVTK